MCLYQRQHRRDVLPADSPKDGQLLTAHKLQLADEGVHSVEPADGHRFKEDQTEQGKATGGVGVKEGEPVDATAADQHQTGAQASQADDAEEKRSTVGEHVGKLVNDAREEGLQLDKLKK